jgi:3-oxoacyl-[acyl-carrier-protein] synthase II
MTLSQNLTQRRRVVVTGIGAVTPLGLKFVDTWEKLCHGQCGVVSLTEAIQCQKYTTEEQLTHDLSFLQPLSCQVAAPVQQFSTTATTTEPLRNTSRVVQFALSAVQDAIQSAGLSDWWGNDVENKNAASNDIHTCWNDPSHFNRRRQRTGVSIGTGMSGVRDIVQAVRTMDGPGGYRRVSPYLVPTILGNAASARVAIQYGFRGPNVSAASACAAGSHAIGDAARYIQSNMADVMISGGAEACIDPLSLVGFSRLRALSTRYNDTPSAASRPFDRNRDGFVMGEGACVIILEELEHAMQRLHGIPPSFGKERRESEPNNEQLFWIELCGYGATSDAHHITSPNPSGIGAIEAMQHAMQEAASTSVDTHMNKNSIHVDYVNAHATSTPVGDEIEARAIEQAIVRSSDDKHPSSSRPLLVSSTKGATGHLLGAAGAIEAAFTIQSLVDQIVPTTLNLEHICDGSTSSTTGDSAIIYVQGKHALPCDDLNVAMSNSFGFGGTNSSLVFRRIRTPEELIINIEMI